MKFIKMEGSGNDYIYIDCLRMKDMKTVEKLKENIKEISDRRLGIGSDGIIFIMPSNLADAKIIIYNADGSKANICGTGIRCVGKYLFEHHITSKNPLSIETDAGIKEVELSIENKKVVAATVNIGSPIILTEQMMIISDEKYFINKKLLIDGQKYSTTCISVGNLHAVVFVDDIEKIDINYLGPIFENMDIFPQRINTEFVEVIDKNNLKVLVWERGSGETISCGSGACAVVAASFLNSYVKREEDINVHFKGGTLKVNYQKNGDILLTGPTEEVYSGKINIKKYR